MPIRRNTQYIQFEFWVDTDGMCDIVYWWDVHKDIVDQTGPRHQMTRYDCRFARREEHHNWWGSIVMEDMALADEFEQTFAEVMHELTPEEDEDE